MTALPDPIDETIVNEFPYPIAAAYDRVLHSDNPVEQADLCIRVFYFSLRSITFALLVEYLTQPLDVSYSKELNASIQEHLKHPRRTMHWVEMLKLTLNAYVGKRKTFFIPELYDLYWDDSVPEQPRTAELWDLLNENARLITSILKGDVNREVRATELLQNLRNILRYFRFMENYDLVYIREIEEHRLSVYVYNGLERSSRSIPCREIQAPDISRIVKERFYLRNTRNELIELHPLIINQDALHAWQSNQGDTGIYDGYNDRDTLDTTDDQVVYLMLASNQSQMASGELLARFLDLYERRLHEKQRPDKPAQLSLSDESIRLACNRTTADQIGVATSKYIDQTYIERENFRSMLDAYMASDLSAVVIAGNAGMGKTNFLLHYYQYELSKRPNIAAIWLDGALLNPDLSLAQTILTVWDRTVRFEKLPENAASANQLLRDILQRYLLGTTLVIIIDGVNENNQPMKAFGCINDFVMEFPEIARVKILMTTRPQVWRYTRIKFLKGQFRPHKYYHDLPEGLADSAIQIENDAFVMSRFRSDELKRAFDRYTRHYDIVNADLRHLSGSLYEAVQEPLLLRLTCEAFRGQAIPPELDADEIIDQLINRVVNDPTMNLEEEDFKFLRTSIVPQFFPAQATPVAKLTEGMLSSVWVNAYHTLDDLVSDTSQDLEREPLNACVQRLMDTGWLVRIDATKGYELRFRYEYFYDYFAGKYLFEQYQTSKDQVAFFERTVAQLNEAPFLWGSVRNLLVDLLKQKDYSRLELLGYTTDIFQTELLVSVLSEYYAYPVYQQGLHRTLLNWLAHKPRDLHAVQITANVAVSREIEDILKLLLVDAHSTIRFFVVQDIYTLWENNPGLTRVLLDHLAREIQWRKLHKNIRLLDTLIRSALFLVTKDYATVGSETLTIPMVQSILKPVLQKLFLVSSNELIEKRMTHARRVLASFLVGWTVLPAIRAIRRASDQTVLNFKDIEMFFPASEHRKQVVMRLLPHLDHSGQREVESLDDLLEYLKELIASRDNDYLTALLAAAVGLSHIFYDPLPAIEKFRAFFEYLEDTYEQTENPERPTATMWVPVMYLVVKSAGHFADSQPEIARKIMDVNVQVMKAKHKRFLESWEFASGAHMQTAWAEDLVRCYGLDIPQLATDTFKEILDFWAERKDYKQIQKIISYLAIKAVGYRLPEGGRLAIYDIIQILAPHVAQMDEKERSTFWDAIGESLLFFASNYKDESLVLIQMFEEDQIPQKVKLRILHASKTEFSSYIMGESTAAYLGRSIREGNASFHEGLEFTVRAALEAKNMRSWIMELAVYVLNRIYGGEIMATKKPNH